MYKRQVIENVLQQFQPDTRQLYETTTVTMEGNYTSALALFESQISPLPPRFRKEAVSYTHLDVYKRQG